MRYASRIDGQTLRGASLGPAEIMRRRRLRPAQFINRRVPLRGFGAVPLQEGVGAGAGAASGASAGATVGSVIPVVGTAIGAVVGAVVGALLGSMGKKDPEDANFQQAEAIYNAQGPAGILAIPNKYLVLAGLFDIQPKFITGNIPIYKKYGRMGEQHFVNDLIQLLYNAGQSGQISANDTLMGVKQKIVDPWIASWGYGPMNDPNAGMIDTLIAGMTAEYLMGGQAMWVDVNGGYPFMNAPRFALPASAPAPQVAAPIAPAVMPTPSGGIRPVVGVPDQPLAQDATNAPTTYGAAPVLPPPSPLFSPPPSYAISGRLPNGHELVVNPGTGAQFDFNAATGILTPFGNTPPIPVSSVGADVAGVISQALQSTGATPAQAISAGVSYVSGGGGGGYFSAPVNPAVHNAVATEVASQTNPLGGLPPWAWAVGAGLLLLVLRRRRSV